MTEHPGSAETRELENSTVFREWANRRRGDRRSLCRAAEVKSLLDLDSGKHPPVLAVVGSKGKGTTAVAASAVLSAARVDVVTVTSPALATNRERIRINGRAIGAREYRRTLRTIQSIVGNLDPPTGGYLSPSGWFLLVGALVARNRAAEALVMEAGRGGRSDELSLFNPLVVAITAIFDEHMSELGGSLEAIARDKIGVAGDQTRQILCLDDQSATVKSVIATEANRFESSVLEWYDTSRSAMPASIGPPGLSHHNMRLGVRAAELWLDDRDWSQPTRRRLLSCLNSVRLVGRLSLHSIRESSQTIVLDAAVNREGFAAAIAWTVRKLGTPPDHILVSLPDDKAPERTLPELQGIPATFVRLETQHLAFESVWPGTSVRYADIEWDRLGDTILALGTVSFVAALVRDHGIETEPVFMAPID